MKKIFPAALALYWMITALPAPLYAYYRCVDAKGRVLFRDFPCPPGYEGERKKDIKASSGPERKKVKPPEKREIAPAAPPGVGGALLFNGGPVVKVTTVKPKFRIRNEDTGREVSAEVRYQKGSFTITGLSPGNYGIGVDINANPENPPGYPGDFRAWKTFQVTESGPATLSLILTRILHLTRPEDNDGPIPRWGEECRGKIAFRNKLTFAWDPVADGAEYDYSITRARCAPFSTGTVVRSGTGGHTSFSLFLPPSGDNDFYLFRLSARRNGKEIGTLVTHGYRGSGGDYRFRTGY